MAGGNSVAVWLSLVALVPFGAAGSSAPDDGVAFDLPTLPAPKYGISPPSDNPEQTRWVTAANETRLRTDTYLPKAREGNVPPAKLPVVMVITPYAQAGQADFPDDTMWLVEQGYAVTYAHVRGTGGSDGCMDQIGRHEADDNARFIEDAGELAPWSSGALGTQGMSQPGGHQIAAATSPDRDRLSSLKALVVGSPVAGFYEQWNHDGVPITLYGAASSTAYFGSFGSYFDTGEQAVERAECQPEILLGAGATSGDYTPYHADRDHVQGIGNLTTPILMWHGHNDRVVNSLTQSGLFDAIPGSTSKVGLFGVMDHENPDDYFGYPRISSPRYDWERADWKPMVLAWYDHWLRGVDNGVDDWPEIQVQNTAGQWRTASEWPSVPGPRGQLALGPGGSLGATSPTASTTYVEGALEYAFPRETTNYPPGTSAVFETAPLSAPLELMGLIELDVWVTLQVPDSHIAAKLEVLAPDGSRVIPEAWTVGARSARHLDPIVDGRFRQAEQKDPPIGEPVKVTVRFDPNDLVVPAGGTLRLTIAGSAIRTTGLDRVTGQQGLYLPEVGGPGFPLYGPYQPSGVVQPVVVHHDCATPSMLRFTMPEKHSRLLNVREKDETGPLTTTPRALPGTPDGGGLATQPVCGLGPTPCGNGLGCNRERPDPPVVPPPPLM